MIFDKLWSILKQYGPYLILLTIVAVFVAYKLRLMKKFGFYLAAVGASVFATGIVAAGNPIFLLFGTCIFLSGNVSKLMACPKL